jgi:hypothetical protein
MGEDPYLVATLGCAYAAGRRGVPASGVGGRLGSGALLGCLALALLAGAIAAGQALPAWSIVLLPTATFLAAGAFAAFAVLLGERRRRSTGGRDAGAASPVQPEQRCRSRGERLQARRRALWRSLVPIPALRRR